MQFWRKLNLKLLLLVFIIYRPARACLFEMLFFTNISSRRDFNSSIWSGILGETVNYLTFKAPSGRHIIFYQALDFFYTILRFYIFVAPQV
jgi:hypothetical protein